MAETIAKPSYTWTTSQGDEFYASIAKGEYDGHIFTDETGFPFHVVGVLPGEPVEVMSTIEVESSARSLGFGDYYYGGKVSKEAAQAIVDFSLNSTRIKQ